MYGITLYVQSQVPVPYAVTPPSSVSRRP